MKKLILLLLWLVSFVISGNAQSDLPERPQPQRLVNNLSTEFPDFFNNEELTTLEKKLENFSNETGNQISVLVVDELYGFEIADFGERIITTWGIGLKEKNNGVLIIIKPTGGKGERDVFIATGYGLEGALPDLVCKRIVENEIIPAFKNGTFYEGINKASDVIMSIAKGEYNEKDYRAKTEGRKSAKFPSWLRILIFVILIIIVLIVKNNGGGGSTFSGRGFRTYRHFGGFGGGGFGGGSSGGGWGGFGGGSGGGGGAGGKW